MDNLAHSLFSVSLTAAVFPKAFVERRKTLSLLSIVVANLPDSDALLAIRGLSNYIFYHRGLTHSWPGLFLMIPVSLAIVSLLPRLWGVTDQLFGRFRNQLLFCFMHLTISHGLLDYLTTYGTMFLYPFSLHKFAFPLMFIIDPFFWITTGLGAVLVLFGKGLTARDAQRRAMVGLLLTGGLWSIELASKAMTEKIIRQNLPNATAVTSLPGPLAPINWMFYAHNAKDDSIPYKQGLVHFSLAEPYVELGDIPARYSTNTCEQADFSDKARAAFAEFAAWTVDFVCEKNSETGSCTCHPLKFAYVIRKIFPFGSYRIERDGRTEFIMSTDGSWGKIIEILVDH